tara:strand:+ start:280 stop:1107 length:828 start_codon:yes stop_codon:yes gene_type:complete
LSGKNFTDENFPVASFIIKKNIQKYIRAFYFFARTADDIADHNNLRSSEKIKILTNFDNILKSESKTSITALNNIINFFPEISFAKKYSRDLLKAFLMDAKGKKYKIWDDLVFYCKYSANPVGRFVIDLIYHKTNLSEKNFKDIYFASDCLCTSLQIINHLQDCKKDFLELKRVYIPKSFFIKHSLKKEILNLEESNMNFFNLVHEIVEKIEIMLDKSNKGLKMIEPWSLRKETLIILNIAKRLCYLLKINDVLRKNVKLSRIDLIFCFIKGIMI